MSSTARNRQEDGEPQRPPVTEPYPHIGRGHPEYHFVQSLMELSAVMHRMDADQKASTARLESKLDALKESTDSTKKKVEDLVRWKTLILGGAVALGIVVSGVFTLYVKFGDRITIAPTVSHQSAPNHTTPPPPPPPKP